MCSFLIKQDNKEEFDYFYFPNCNNTTNEQFVVSHHINLLKEGKECKYYTLRYSDGVSLIDETFEIVNLATKLLFSDIPVEKLPKIMFEDKYRAVSIHKSGQPIWSLK